MALLPAEDQLGPRPGTRTAPRAGSLDRRNLMRITSLSALGAVVASGAGTALAEPASAAPVQWPGHKPGSIYLGASSQDFNLTVDRAGALGLRRTYYKWGDGARELRNIKNDHAARRLPWISFKPPSSSPGGWNAISSGKYDADIRARARRYAGLSQPVIVTFNHEPHNDRTGTAAEFAKAWSRIHDVMDSETGLENVVSVPIIGDWVFNPVNRNDEPQYYLTPAVLDRCHFLGVDTYQNSSGQGFDVRVGRVLDFLSGRGYPTTMVGVGECGATDGYGSPSGAQWWSDSWRWCADNSNRVAAVSYFNSLHNNNSGNNWLLWQSNAKLNAFRASVSSSTACRL